MMSRGANAGFGNGMPNFGAPAVGDDFDVKTEGLNTKDAGDGENARAEWPDDWKAYVEFLQKGASRERENAGGEGAGKVEVRMNPEHIKRVLEARGAEKMAEEAKGGGAVEQDGGGIEPEVQQAEALVAREVGEGENVEEFLDKLGDVQARLMDLREMATGDNRLRLSSALTSIDNVLRWTKASKAVDEVIAENGEDGELIATTMRTLLENEPKYTSLLKYLDEKEPGWNQNLRSDEEIQKVKGIFEERYIEAAKMGLPEVVVDLEPIFYNLNMALMYARDEVSKGGEREGTLAAEGMVGD